MMVLLAYLSLWLSGALRVHVWVGSVGVCRLSTFQTSSSQKLLDGLKPNFK